MSLQEIIACIGFPVAGNPTQFVMERAFEAAGLDARCLTADVAPESLERAIGGMSAMGFRGGVMAEPHFSAACKLVDRLEPPALMLGSMDLIYREDEQLIGEHASVRAIMELLLGHVDLKDQRAVVLGTGEVAAAATLALALSGVAHIQLVARDDSSAERIVKVVSEHTPCQVEEQPWVDMLRLSSDARVVVQASGATQEIASSKWQLDFSNLNSQTLLLDTVYLPLRTEFLKKGESANCQTLNGLDLLVQWARVAFEIWTGTEPDAAVVRDAFEEFFLI